MNVEVISLIGFCEIGVIVGTLHRKILQWKCIFSWIFPIQSASDLFCVKLHCWLWSASKYFVFVYLFTLKWFALIKESQFFNS